MVQKSLDETSSYPVFNRVIRENANLEDLLAFADTLSQLLGLRQILTA